MKSTKTGRILMTMATCVYGFIPPFVDFNQTHATNPLWIGHARFHVVWQVGIMFGIALLALRCLWFTARSRLHTQLALLLGLIVLVPFELNVLARPLYQGTLADPNGVPPVMGVIDANLLAFSVALVLLLMGWWLASRPQTKQHETAQNLESH